MNDDQSLGTPAPRSDDTPSVDLHAPVTSYTVEDVLNQARRVKRTARICIRGDLLDVREGILDDLSSLVDPRGNVIEPEAEASIGDVTNATRAQQLSEELVQVDATIAGFMWTVQFEGMDSDTWVAFHKAYFPKGEGADLTVFNNKLIAATAIQPPITEEQMVALRKKLGLRQINELSNKAWEACNAGGVDIPKSPSSLLNLAKS